MKALGNYWLNLGKCMELIETAIDCEPTALHEIDYLVFCIVNLKGIIINLKFMKFRLLKKSWLHLLL